MLYEPYSYWPSDGSLNDDFEFDGSETETVASVKGDKPRKKTKPKGRIHVAHLPGLTTWNWAATANSPSKIIVFDIFCSFQSNHSKLK